MCTTGMPLRGAARNEAIGVVGMGNGYGVLEKPSTM